MASEKQLAVLLFTDIVGSVALQNRLGTEAYTRYITRHDAIFKHCLSYVRGSSILNETGDGFLVKFGSASDAVETALRLQCLLREEVCEGEKMVLRIGLHMGEVSEMEEQITGDTRAVGMAINLCARIMDLATDGQILLTRGVFDEARQYTREHPFLKDYDAESLPPLQWPAHGRYIFKGTDEPMDMYEVGALGWAPLTPPEDSAKAQRAVSADEEATLGWRPGAGLPIPRHEKWVIVKKLGQGGFGEVWLAENADTKDQRVFKFCFDPEKLRSFKRELTLFRLLRDALGKRDDIAALYDVSVESPPFYLESEYVPAGNMAHWAESKGGIRSIDLSIRVDLMARISRALAAAHSVGIIHKDIKPSNILIHEANGKPYPRIADFGIGALSDSANLQDHDITGAGFTESIVIESDGGGGSSGTQLYMAPEYLIGAPSSVRGDVFSLGVMLYQMAAGDLTKPMGSGWQRDIEDPLLREDILKCVDIDPERRFENANQLAEQLESLSDRRKAKKRREEEEAHVALLKRQAEKRRRLIALGGVALLGLSGMVAVLFRGLEEQRALKDQAKMTSSRADYALAGEHLKQEGKVGVAVAHLARALKANPEHRDASVTLSAALAHHVFPRPLYPPVGSRGRNLDKGYGQLSRDGQLFAASTVGGGVELIEVATGRSRTGALLDNREDPLIWTRFNQEATELFVFKKAGFCVISTVDGRLIRETMLEGRYGHSHHATHNGFYWIGDDFGEPLLHVHEIFGERKYTVPDVKGTGRLVRYDCSPDGRYLSVLWQNAQGTGIVSVCDLQQEVPEWNTIYRGPPWSAGPPPAVGMGSMSRLIAFDNRRGGIAVRELATGETVYDLGGERDFILNLEFSPDGVRLAAGHFGQKVRVWDLQTGKVAVDHMAHRGMIMDMAFSSDGARLLTASFDRYARIWDPSNGALLAQPMRHGDEVISVAFDESEKHAHTVTLGGQGTVWGISRQAAQGAPLGYSGEVLALSQNQKRAVVRSGSQIDLLGDDLQKPLWSLDRVSEIDFCEFRGDALLIRCHGEGEDEMKALWRINSDGTTAEATLPFREVPRPGRRPRTIHAHLFDYEPSRNLLLISELGDGRPDIDVRSFEDPNAVLKTLVHDRPVNSGYFTPGGRYVLTIAEQEAFVWDLEEAEPQGMKLGAGSVLSSVAMAKEIPHALLGSVIGSARLWDLATQEPMGESLHHDGPVFLVDVDADATMAVTLSLPLRNERELVAELRAWNLVDSTPLTPPIPVDTPSGFNIGRDFDDATAFLSLTEDTRQALVSLAPGYRYTVDLHLGPSASFLPEMAETLTGHRLDDLSGRLVDHTLAEGMQLGLTETPDDSFWKPWVEWLGGGPGQRMISPTSDWTEDRYLKLLLGRNDVRSAKRALAMSPNHPRALANLAKVTMEGEEDVTPTNSALASFYVKRAVGQADVVSSDNEGTYCIASEVCLHLGDLALDTDPETARHHYAGALRSAKIAYEANPGHVQSRIHLAQAYLRQSQLAEIDHQPSLRDAYLEAIYMIASLLDAEGEDVSALLVKVKTARWPFDEASAAVPSESTWRYTTTRPEGEDWRNVSLDDTDWKEGQAPLGYGESFVNTFIQGTALSVFARHRFTLEEPLPAGASVLRLLYDDGVAVYLDGTRIHRENMDERNRVTQVLDSKDEGIYFDREVRLEALPAGEHVLALLVKQIDFQSSDLVMDLAFYPGRQSTKGPLANDGMNIMTNVTEQLGKRLPENWLSSWRFYYGDVADAASPLAQDPAAFYRRALLQDIRGRTQDARAAAQAVLRMTQNDADSPWAARAKVLLELPTP